MDVKVGVHLEGLDDTLRSGRSTFDMCRLQPVLHRPQSVCWMIILVSTSDRGDLNAILLFFNVQPEQVSRTPDFKSNGIRPDWELSRRSSSRRRLRLRPQRKKQNPA